MNFTKLEKLKEQSFRTGKEKQFWIELKRLAETEMNRSNTQLTRWFQ